MLGSDIEAYVIGSVHIYHFAAGTSAVSPLLPSPSSLLCISLQTSLPPSYYSQAYVSSEEEAKLESCVGALVLLSDKPRAFTVRDQRWLQGLAEYMCLTLT